MCKNQNKNLILKTIGKLVEDEIKFFVDDYQRGYRWTAQNVIDLLNDISGFKPLKQKAEELKRYIDNYNISEEKSIEKFQNYINNFNSDFYSLQPIVLKEKKRERENEKIEGFELIDGQQRMTTIFIILSILGKKKFSIEYKTREESAEFLEKITKIIGNDNTISFDTDVVKFQEKINKKWRGFIENKENCNNIDNYHFFGAYLTAKAWFEKHEEKKEDFYKNLINHTKVIWYEIKNKETDSRDVFARLNSGKIPLTNAELIKALFLLKRKDAKNRTTTLLKQREIATEWDRIEYTLQNNDFWSFLNANNSNSPTRIDFIFDLISGRGINDDNYFSFRCYDELFKKGRKSNKCKHGTNIISDKLFKEGEKSIEEAWEDVKNYFLIFQEWYEDRELYHLIGYITSLKISNIKKLISEYQEKTKSEFKNYLKGKIKTNLVEKHKHKEEKSKKKKEKLEIRNLSYKDNYDAIKNTLFLFNVLETLNLNNNERYNFMKHNDLKWSLEHIHAQNSENLKDKKQWLTWFIEIKDSIKALNEFNEKEYENCISLLEGDNELTVIEEKIQYFYNKTVKLFQNEGTNLKHDISNIALLDSKTNSALNNSIFPVKRKLIFEKLEQGTFIPICTQNVFLKRYSSGISQMYFWGDTDRESYLKAIETTLTKLFT